MKKVICITGSPATGKKGIGMKVAHLLGCEHMSLLDLAGRLDAILTYDEQSHEYVLDVDKLSLSLRSHALPPDLCVISGTLIPYVVPPDLTDLVVVLRASPKVLYERYIVRGYDRRKISENLIAEALGVVLDEAMRRYGEDHVHEIDVTDLSPDDVAAEISGVLEQGVTRVYRIDWLEECSSDDLLRDVCFDTST